MIERRPSYDPLLLAAVLGLVGFGLVMVYSASAVTAQEKVGDGFHFLKRQGIAACIGSATHASVRVGRWLEQRRQWGHG